MLESIQDISIRKSDNTGLSLFSRENHVPFADIDVYGEQKILPQVILFSEESPNDYIAVRYDENGKIEEVFIPDSWQDRLVGDTLTPWLKRRDGR